MTGTIEGRLLLASPMLGDTNFFRSVVYIAKHDVGGAFGLVVNRPSNMRLETVVEQARGRCPQRRDAIYVGGPVEGPLLALHEVENLGEPCTDGVWLTSDDDHLMVLCDRTDVRARFFSGYSGWGPGQLEAELRAGGWLVAPFAADHIFGDPSQVWEEAVKQQGRAVLRSIAPAAGNIDPQMN